MHYKGLCTDNRRAQRPWIASTTPQNKLKITKRGQPPRPRNAQAGLPFSRDPERTWDELYTSQAWAGKCKEDAGGTQELWGGAGPRSVTRHPCGYHGRAATARTQEGHWTRDVPVPRPAKGEETQREGGRREKEEKERGEEM